MNVIPENTLIDFVLDLLDEPERKVIETEMLHSTDLCSRIASLRDSLLIAPAISCKTVEPSANLMARLMKSADSDSPFEGFVDRLSVFLDLPEKRIRSLLNSVKSAQTEWHALGAPGVLGKVFDGGPRHAEAECSLVLMQPGAVIPKHGHLGDEWGFVLQGKAMEDNGRIIRAGELVYQSEETRHSFTNIGDTPVIFALVHRGLKFD